MQKDTFLNSEGDAWFERNHQALMHRKFEDDPVVQALNKIPSKMRGGRLLEIGCGEGRRLTWLAEKLQMHVHGIEPSAKAVASARQFGLDVVLGTAERLPYESGTFDVVVFGFCLYLCDREDLFRIACEADRVIAERGWLIIHDFFSPEPMHRDYHHKAGISSYKMDYRNLFAWHPGYTCFSHEVRQHSSQAMTDDRQEWTATSILRKNF